jgi:intermediate cleaving peptidase 55
VLPDIIAGKDHVFTDLPRIFQPKSDFSQYLSGAPLKVSHGIKKAIKDADSLKPLRPIMNKLRAVKSEAEIVNMRIAGKASGRAFTEAMAQDFDFERDLKAFLDYRFIMHGCDGPAYVPVVAGGKNALSIHYVRNDDVINDNELVLVDAGGEYGGYITDITRTWPKSGEFSPPQKDLYQVILNAQRSCVSLCREDANMTLDKLHKVAENGLRDGLTDVGFDVSGGGLDILFPHHVGHYIGLDVHDVPGFPRSERLIEGHCITIEP